MSTPDDLERRLRTLEDEREIARTLAQYCHAKDHGDGPAELLDCFTPTGSFRWTPTGRWSEPSTARYAGHAELEAWDAEASRNRNAPGRFGKHFIALPAIDLQGDRARVETYMIRTVESPDGPVVATMGRYHDTFVRCPDGRWRIEERVLERESTVPAGPDRLEPGPG